MLSRIAELKIMTCMASLYEILFYSEPMSKGTKFWILVHFYVYNLIFTTWEFFCMYFSAKWYWWLKGLIPRIQKMHRGQIDLASMYEIKSVEKNESISPKWTQMDWMDSSMQYIINVCCKWFHCKCDKGKALMSKKSYIEYQARIE